MDITSIKPADNQPTGSNNLQRSVNPIKLDESTDTKTEQKSEAMSVNKKPDKEDLERITDETNKFMQMINTDLQFSVHEKTKQLMVQVVDTKEQRVIKEFPSHEFLDTMAKIREYVGFLLDKKV
jgi:flagellar protein FlaG